MRSAVWRRPGRFGRVVVLVVGLAPLLAAGRAEGQWGYGLFWNPNYRPASVDYIQQQSIARGQAAAAERPQPLTAAPMKVRDEGYFDRYDIETRRGLGERASLYTRSTPPPSTPAAPEPPPRVVHLANYFDASRRLVWPANAPTAGDLGPKRETSDRASLAVLDQYQARGNAEIATVTDARQKLLDYGRPALRSIRQHATPAIADSFHAFLLSLYSNLELAASVPRAPSR